MEKTVNTSDASKPRLGLVKKAKNEPMSTLKSEESLKIEIWILNLNLSQV